MTGKDEKDKKQSIDFGIEDIGSDILRRFSDDMYGAESIIRELVKNATDSYSQLEEYCRGKEIPCPEDYDEKRVDITTDKDQLFILDKGIGCDRTDIKKLIKISISDKISIPGTTGFRGIGFWAAFSAGEKIIVKSTKLGQKELCTLEINTARLRTVINSQTDIGTVINDVRNVSIEYSPYDENEHFTQITIECVGEPVTDVKQNENRLYDVIHGDKADQLEFIKKTCMQGLPTTHPLLSEIEKFYELNDLPLHVIAVNGDLLRKDLDDALIDFQQGDIIIKVRSGKKVSSKIVAEYWYVRNPGGKVIENGEKGVRLFKDGYPVGGYNLYADPESPTDTGAINQQNLNHYYCEVHLLDELVADANGQNIVDGEYRRKFKDELRKIYKKLEEEERVRSQTKSREREFQTAIKKLKNFDKQDDDTVILNVKEAKDLISEHNKNLKEKVDSLSKKNKKVIDQTTKIRNLATNLTKNIKNVESSRKELFSEKKESEPNKEKGEKEKTTKTKKTDETWPEKDTIRRETREAILRILDPALKDKKLIEKVLTEVDLVFKGE